MYWEEWQPFQWHSMAGCAKQPVWPAWITLSNVPLDRLQSFNLYLDSFDCNWPAVFIRRVMRCSVTSWTGRKVRSVRRRAVNTTVGLEEIWKSWWGWYTLSHSWDVVLQKWPQSTEVPLESRGCPCPTGIWRTTRHKHTCLQHHMTLPIKTAGQWKSRLSSYESKFRSLTAGMLQIKHVWLSWYRNL